jgi:hypothetical protein
MSSGAWSSARMSPRVAVAIVVALLAGYAAIGLHRQTAVLQQKPLPAFLMEDYNCYGRAWVRWRAGESPYADQNVGSTAFLYPPQSLLLVGGFEAFHTLAAKFATYTTLSLLALAAIVALGLRASRTPPGDPKAWAAAILALGFAPVGTSLFLGQVNILVACTLAAGYFLADRHPRIAGAAIALGAAIKVTPVFLLVLFLRRRYLSLWLSFLATSAALAGVTAMVLGVGSFREFLAIAHKMNDTFPVGFTGSLSFINLVYLLGGKFGGLQEVGAWQPFGQRLYSLVLLVVVLAAAFLTRDGRRRDLLFAMVSLAITVMPNVLWYHHFVFVLPALFALWLSPESTPALRAGALAGLGLIQLDHLLGPKLDKLTTTPVCLVLIAVILTTLVRKRHEVSAVDLAPRPAALNLG